MSFRKGSSPDRAAGNVFFISMLSLSASGAYLALMKHQMNNVFGGVLTFYMVATAWVTVRRKDKANHRVPEKTRASTAQDDGIAAPSNSSRKDRD